MAEDKVANDTTKDSPKDMTEQDLRYVAMKKMEMQQIWEYIQNLPPGEERDRLTKLLTQDYEGLKDLYGEDLEAANALMSTSMPQLRSVGGIAVAPHWTEYLASALRQGQGAYDRYKAQGRLEQLSKDRQEGLAKVWDAAAGRPEVDPTASIGVPPQGGYDLGNMKPPMRKDNLSGLEHGMENYSPAGYDSRYEARQAGMTEPVVGVTPAQATSEQLRNPTPAVNPAPSINAGMPRRDESGVRIPIRRDRPTTVLDAMPRDESGLRIPIRRDRPTTVDDIYY